MAAKSVQHTWVINEHIKVILEYVGDTGGDGASMHCMDEKRQASPAHLGNNRHCCTKSQLDQAWHMRPANNIIDLDHKGQQTRQNVNKYDV